jgi:two-component system, chemotaxis family, sensor kinase CheA
MGCKPCCRPHNPEPEITMTLDDDAEIIAAAREGFLDEAADMLAQFEQALLVMETDPQDTENLNAAFRAAHTIKGTAGLFGCDAVVAFTHEVEAMLESLRAASLTVNDDIAAALLEGRDQMGALIDEVRTGAADPGVAARGEALAARLRTLRGAGAAQASESVSVHAGSRAAALPATVQTAGTASCWHLSLRFGTDALRNGLDPLAFLRYLSKLGEVRAIHLLTEAVPSLADLDAEDCHLGFELRLDSQATASQIEEVFEFAIDDCSLTILPPAATPADYDGLLAARCGDDADARRALRDLWHALGVPSHEPQSEPAPAAAGSTPPVERRAVGRSDRRQSGGDETRYVKVRADKLDHLIDLIGELVIASSGAQMVASSEGSTPFLEAAHRMTDLVQATRDGALALRMVPVGETFARFQRVVRDVSKQLGKEIELVVTGGDTELDKSLVEVIADPLMHLVRNSLDHGLELPADRVAAGKPALGRLGLNAYHEGSSIVIEISDDGRGLNRERLLRKAIERGLVAPDAVLSDNEICQLIFAPGFSTAEAVTDLSGRGVGMDVVRRNIESLRGQIALASTEGRGTTTQIRLPLTLAMIDGFLTTVGGVHYVLPLSVVSECIEVPRDCTSAIGQPSGYFDLRGEVLPYLDLAAFYGVAPSADGRRRSLIVVRDGAVRIGLVVDRLLGEHQTVIKPLAPIFGHLKALAGSTILGSGDVALVLDMQGLLAAATRPGAALARPRNTSISSQPGSAVASGTRP